MESGWGPGRSQAWGVGGLVYLALLPVGFAVLLCRLRLVRRGIISEVGCLKSWMYRVDDEYVYCGGWWMVDIPRTRMNFRTKKT